VRLPKTTAVLHDQRGMTLIELVIVMIVIAILLVIAASSYMGYRERASDSAAQANIHNVVPSIQGYYVDHDSYTGMTLDGLKAQYDAAIDPALYSFGTSPPAGETYCVHTTSGGRTWRKNGPAAELERLPCP
jgi:prepilin-type N-terminal cleavage/methylation domain-containing protein